MSKEIAKPFKFKRMKIPIEIKKQIIEKREKGVSVIDIAREYNRNTSTICSILKDKEKLKAATVSKGVSRRSDKRSNLIDDVERLLLVWINEKRLQGESISQPIVCEKAKRIFNDLVAGLPSASSGKTEAFKASNGWFERFKQRTGIHKVHVQVEIEQKHIEELLSLEHMEDSSTEEEPSALQRVSAEKEKINPQSTDDIRKVLQAWDTISSYVLQYHPDEAVALRANDIYEANAISHFRLILKQRQKHTT